MCGERGWSRHLRRDRRRTTPTRRRHSIISERQLLALQRNPHDSEVERSGFSSPRDWRVARVRVARDILIRVRAPVSRRCRSATASCSIRPEGESNEETVRAPAGAVPGRREQCPCKDVRYNFAKETDFATFKTYKWVPIKVPSLSAISSTDRSRAPSTSNLPPKA